MNAILTGSRVFGKVKPYSDVDLVVLADGVTKEKLIQLSDHGKEPVRFGRLNLILCTSIEEQAAWVLCTVSMTLDKQLKGITYSSEEAKRCLDTLREMVGIKDSGQSGGK